VAALGVVAAAVAEAHYGQFVVQIHAESAQKEVQTALATGHRFC
jgi:imidazolonepropionase-like amidohydrolase